MITALVPKLQPGNALVFEAPTSSTAATHHTAEPVVSLAATRSGASRTGAFQGGALERGVLYGVIFNHLFNNKRFLPVFLLLMLLRNEACFVICGVGL